MLPDLPNDIIMEIMKHRKIAMYLDMKEKKQQKHKNNLLQEISFQVEDLQMCIERIYDDCDTYNDDTECYDSEELEAIENTPYSLLLLENVMNYNYYEKLYGTKLEEDY